jgi:hypothetical protein
MVYFQQMLKHPVAVKETERLAAVALRDLLEEIPPVALQSIKIDQPAIGDVFAMFIYTDGGSQTLTSIQWTVQ